MPRFRFRRRIAPSAPALGGANIGINVPKIGYFEPIDMFTDLVRAGYLWGVVGSSGEVSEDAAGWPEDDFDFIYQWIPEGGAGEIVSGSFNGEATLQVIGSPTRTLQNQVYTLGTNTTTFEIALPTGDRGGNHTLRVTDTKRTNASATGTGITNLKLFRPGYGHATTETFTTAFKTYESVFTIQRYMDVLQVINSPDVNWSDRRISTDRRSGGLAYEDLIALSNDIQRDPWICTPLLASDDYITQLATLLNTTLDPDLICYIEQSNEMWNFGFSHYFTCVDRVCPELLAFYDLVGGSSGRGIVSATRASGVVTIVTSAAHGWTNGQNIYVTGIDGGSGTTRVATVVNSTTATYPHAGTDGALTINSSSWIVGVTGSGLAYDGETSIYVLAQRGNIRRTKEISDLFRAVVGDAAMQTRFRILWAFQAVSRQVLNLDYIASEFPSRAVDEYFWATSGAPYFNLGSLQTDSNAAITVQDYVDELVLDAGNSKVEYLYDHHIIDAGLRGLKYIHYEGGPDTAGDSGASNNLKKTLAHFDAGIQAPYEEFMSDMFDNGVFGHVVYNGDLIQSDESYPFGAWGQTNATTNLAAPKMAAIISLRNGAQPSASRNLIPATIDARHFAGQYGDVSADSYPTNGDTHADANQLTRGRLAYVISAPSTGSYDLTISYRRLDSSTQTANIVVNGVTISGITWTYTDTTNVYELAPVSVPLVAGANAVEIVRTGEGYLGGAYNEVRGLEFV